MPAPPNMDKMAAAGCNFTQAVSSTPVCAVHRASLMTGKYQSSTGMVINELRLSPEHDCFGHCLTRAGYQTAYIGKWHMWANQMGHHNLIKNGFTPPGAYRLGFDGYWAAYNFNTDYEHGPYFLNDAEPHIRKQYEPDGQTDMAIDYLKSVDHHADPFALFVSWGPPHDPWGMNNVESEYLDLYRNVDLPLAPNYSTISDPYADNWQKLPADYGQRVHDWMRVYYAQVANIDWNLGRLLKAVDDAGIADNTVLVFTTDHGEMFGAHGRRAKYIFYEESARVPFPDALAQGDPCKDRIGRVAGDSGYHAHHPFHVEHSYSRRRGRQGYEQSCTGPWRRRSRCSSYAGHGRYRGVGRRNGMEGAARS